MSFSCALHFRFQEISDLHGEIQEQDSRIGIALDIMVSRVKKLSKFYTIARIHKRRKSLSKGQISTFYTYEAFNVVVQKQRLPNHPQTVLEKVFLPFPA
jgi:hypothetical protein